LFAEWNFEKMPPRSIKVEAAARTLILLEELNRHRVASIQLLHQPPVCRIDGGPADEIVCAMAMLNDRGRRLYVASRVKSLSNGFHGDRCGGSATMALAFTGISLARAIAVLDGLGRVGSAPFRTARCRVPRTINMHLSLLRARSAGLPRFCPADERRCCSTCYRDRAITKTGWSATAGDPGVARIHPQAGFCRARPDVEPRSSGHRRTDRRQRQGACYVGMTYFMSRWTGACGTYHR